VLQRKCLPGDGTEMEGVLQRHGRSST
jgi:hypothetical protein